MTLLTRSLLRHAGFVCAAVAISASARHVPAQELQRQLTAESAANLARAAREEGDAKRGAILFFQPHLACAKCHGSENPDRRLGPDLSRRRDPQTEANDGQVTDEQLVEAILNPSKVIRKGYETVAIATADGHTLNGLIAEERADSLVLRDAGQYGKLVTILKTQIEQRVVATVSLMPAGQVNQLTSRQQFLDLVKYLIEIRDGGPARALELKPDAALTAAWSLPEYEAHLDHAGLIRGWNAASLKRGEAIYLRVCANCHGTHEMAGTLPTALRFAEGKFKSGSDPLAMYQTLTRGFGFMVPQMWMVPQQKYDVIHYIREAYLKPRNTSQYAPVNEEYLARLPRGDSLGPPPSNIEPWVVMDYGPRLINTYEIPRPELGSRRNDRPNIAYKGIAVRLDDGPGGVSRGHDFAIFDHDTLRLAAAWSGQGFIDWNGIHFNGRHQVHPTIVGDVLASNPVGPGWANPLTGSFDDPRLRGRDDRPYGPLPRAWAQYRGLYQHAERTIVSYTVGATPVLESMRMVSTEKIPLSTADTTRPPPQPPLGSYIVRDFHLGPRERPLTLLVATRPGGEVRPLATAQHPEAAVVVAAAKSTSQTPLVAGVTPPIRGARWRFDADGRILLDLPAGSDPLPFSVWLRRAPDLDSATHLTRDAEFLLAIPNLTLLTRGAAPRWPHRINTHLARGREEGPFAVDVLTPPNANPWLAQTRLTGFDFFTDSDRAAVCSWDGDVWLLSGLSASAPADPPATLQWQRIASGLFQPLGLKIIAGQIYVTCRDQIVILRDLNGDGETDFYECYNNDHQVTEHFHEFAMGLQTDAAGNLYYAKSARHALPALVPHHGTLLRVSRDGARTEIIANGFRAANGVCLNPDGSFLVTDQEGHWNPKNRINWVTLDPSGRPKFYGNLFGYHDVTDSSDSAMEPPLCWITNEFDRSPAELLWVSSKSWGPLNGSLLNLSYGNGKLFVAPHERVQGVMQGGLVALPLPPFPTGVMRGRFHPSDGQLYLCGMFAWAGSATQPGGMYRVRPTGQPIHLPVELHVRKSQLTLTFTEPLDPAALDTKAVQIKTWSLKRTANYGSKHYDEQPLEVRGAQLSTDGRTLTLDVPDLAPVWCMEIKYSLRSRTGQAVSGVLHNTIHALAD
jgi:putative heme-binding domain-containing protein